MIRAASALALFLAPGAMESPPEWTQPTEPFRIVGNIWYVGTEGLAAYAIKTSAGTILIDATMVENVPAIERNLAAIGVPIRDVRTILVTHAHFDHVSGDAALKAASGARLVAGARDVAALESGTPPGETSYGVIRFPAVEVDRGIRDKETVTLGDTTLTAIATPGHTPGCTSWAMRVVEKGRPLSVVFPCSISVAGNILVGNRAYPGIVADYRRSFDRLAATRADVVLPAHPGLADVIGRRARGDSYVAPALLGTMVAEARVAFDAELAKQRKVRLQ